MGKIVYQIRPSSTRRKSIRLVVQANGEVIVTASPWMPRTLIDQFVQRKASWIEKHLKAIKEGTRPKPLYGDKAEFEMLRATAYAFAKERLDEIVARYGFRYQRLTIRNTRTRWGSCSRRGAISIHYKILFLTPELAEYLLVHEACHLKEMNHSGRFWALVKKEVVDYEKMRKGLRHWTVGAKGKEE